MMSVARYAAWPLLLVGIILTLACNQPASDQAANNQPASKEPASDQPTRIVAFRNMRERRRFLKGRSLAS